jgi:hypothetical protein
MIPTLGRLGNGIMGSGMLKIRMGEFGQLTLKTRDIGVIGIHKAPLTKMKGHGLPILENQEILEAYHRKNLNQINVQPIQMKVHLNGSPLLQKILRCHLWRLIHGCQD